MTNKEAIDILRNAAWLGTDANREQIEEAVEMAINALTAQEQLAKNSPELDKKNGELIRRKAAIEALKEAFNPSITNFVKAKIAIDKLPSAQPETHDERTETHSCDCISRWAVIGAVDKNRDTVFHNSVDYEGVLCDISNLPSVQPEVIRCKECKHWSRESICDGFCSEDCMRHDEDFYCGYAERKE